MLEIIYFCYKYHNMKYNTVEEIKSLIEQFQTQTLPVSLWTHEAHLSVALWHLWHYSKAEALCYLRAGIITYNVAVDTPNTPTRGYHETLTVFWIEILSQFLSEFGRDKSLLETTNALLESTMAEKSYPFQFYEREKQ